MCMCVCICVWLHVEKYVTNTIQTLNRVDWMRSLTSNTFNNPAIVKLNCMAIATFARMHAHNQNRCSITIESAKIARNLRRKKRWHYTNRHTHMMVSNLHAPQIEGVWKLYGFQSRWQQQHQQMRAQRKAKRNVTKYCKDLGKKINNRKNSDIQSSQTHKKKRNVEEKKTKQNELNPLLKWRAFGMTIPPYCIKIDACFFVRFLSLSPRFLASWFNNFVFIFRPIPIITYKPNERTDNTYTCKWIKMLCVSFFFLLLRFKYNHPKLISQKQNIVCAVNITYFVSIGPRKNVTIKPIYIF